MFLTPTVKYSIAVAVLDVPGYGSHVHTHDHGVSEDPDGSPDSILLSEPMPLEKHSPPPLQSILSPREKKTSHVCDTHGSSAMACNTRDIDLHTVIDLSDRSAIELYRSHILVETRVDKSQPLARWRSDSRYHVPYGFYRLVEGLLSSGHPEVWIWVGHPDDGSNGDGTCGGNECACGAVHLARRSRLLRVWKEKKIVLDKTK
ncbi:hypothetical protein Tco_0711435 [Tanacetum coccineum]